MGAARRNAENDAEPREVSLESVAEALAALRARLDQGAVEERAHKKAFDQLYEELNQYKEDFLFKAEKPLLLDLLLFYDSLSWFQGSLVQQQASTEVVADSFQYLLDEFLELLYRRDVVPMEVKATFDRQNHRAVQVIETTDPRRDQAVEQVLKRGFLRGDRVLRPEEVVIAKLTRA